MPLRHAPRLTPRSLAARRANALKSTGPRTPCGKARVSLNSLKHGRGLGCPARFRERLLRAGYAQQEALYEGLRACLTQAFGARTAHWRREVDRFAIRAWCVATGKDFFRTKLECDFDSTPKGSRVLSEDLQQGRSPSRRHRPGLTRSLRYRAEDNYRRIGVAFWIQQRRYLTRGRVRRMLAGLEPFTIQAADEGLENRVRCHVFRLRRPEYFERLTYGLDRNGDPDWSREPWRSVARSGKVSRRRRVEVRVSGPAGAVLFANAEHARVRIVAEGAPSPATGFPKCGRSIEGCAGSPGRAPLRREVNANSEQPGAVSPATQPGGKGLLLRLPIES